MEFKEYSNNELIPMSRRYPNLKQKVLDRDGKIARPGRYPRNMLKIMQNNTPNQKL